MQVKLSTIIAIVISIIGGALMTIPYVGLSILLIGVITLIWALAGCIAFRRMSTLIGKRIHTKFIKADFDAIGMTSPYVNFYVNIHSCLSYQLKLTGNKKGDLWNPHIEAWRSTWTIDTKYQSVILPDTDTVIRIRWDVPRAHPSPMTEFAFRAIDKPPIQNLTFEDMRLELEARFLRLKHNIGWFQLSQAPVEVEVPDHPTFESARRAWEREKGYT